MFCCLFQALLIRERILGRNHPETHYYLRYRGAIYADIGQFERCFQLWMHALDLQVNRCLMIDYLIAIHFSAVIS
jgi:hypothetical protein